MNLIQLHRYIRENYRLVALFYIHYCHAKTKCVASTSYEENSPGAKLFDGLIVTCIERPLIKLYKERIYYSSKYWRLADKTDLSYVRLFLYFLAMLQRIGHRKTISNKVIFPWGCLPIPVFKKIYLSFYSIHSLTKFGCAPVDILHDNIN